jgi:hypothetical protein
MGRGIPTALLGRKLKKGGHANRTDAGAPKAKPKAVKAAPKAAAPVAPAAKPEVSMENTKAELITAAEGLGVTTKGLTKAQLVAAIEAA